MDIGTLYLQSALKELKGYKTLGDKALDRLTREEMHYQPNEGSNSIAVIIQHLHGNMLSRWTNFLTEDGEKSWRDRDKEFENNALSKAELLQLWNDGWHVFLMSLVSLTNEDLSKTITIRNQPLMALDAINRQLAHCSYHTGQIVYVAKWLRNADWETLSIPKKGT